MAEITIELTVAEEVAFSELDTWLQSQPINTPSTPYILKITGLTSSDVGSSDNPSTLGGVLKENSQKYVDLSETQLPNGEYQELAGTFYECETLIKPPLLPSGVSYLSYTFRNCSNMINAPIIPDSVITMDDTFYGCESMVNAPAIPSGVTTMYSAFLGCKMLNNAPFIPEGVTNMIYTFSGCESLQKPALFPSGVTNVDGCYYDCTSLEYKAIIPSSVISSISCYSNVTTNNWGGTEEQVSDFLPTFLSTTATDSELYVIDAVEESGIYNIIDTIYAVSIENLSDLLESLEDNTTNNPYKIALINLTTTNISDIQSNLISNATKFVDLRYTTLPSGSNVDNLFYYCVNLVYGPVLPSDITSMTRTFIYCSNLKESPEIPSSVTSMMYTFEDCENLIVPPAIPNGVTDITEIFFNCESLEIAPSIPSSVVTMDYAFVQTKIKTGPYISEGIESMNQAFVGCTSMLSIPNVPSTITEGSSAFSGCTELVSIDRFAVPLATLKNNADFENMFADCGALERIGYIVSEAEDWHVFRLKVSSGNYDEVEGKVYDREGNSVSIPSTTVTLGTLTIPVLVDELWFPPSNMLDADIDDVIEEVIACRYSYFNKMVVNPNKKSFVLYADDPDEVITNLNLGGGGADVPLGSVMAYYGTTDPADKNWLICDGRDTTGTDIELETHYPSFYVFNGRSNVLPDLRECALVGVGQNGTNTIATHDVYTLGQFKDDQMQKITGDIQGYYGDNLSANGSFYPRTAQSKTVGNSWVSSKQISIDTSRQTRTGTPDVTHGKQKGVNWIIKATSTSDSYHLPTQEILQVEQYFDEGLSKAESYSTTETWTGGYWIDGKKIYRKVVYCGALPNATTKSVTHNISNMATLIKLGGFSIGTSDTMPIPYINVGNLSYGVQLYVSSTTISIQTGTNRTNYASTYIILEYTKTTD